MYLTAHRVRSPSSGKHGINSFLYEHGSTPAVEGMSLQSSDVRRVAEQQPGTLKTDWIEVVPGGIGLGPLEEEELALLSGRALQLLQKWRK